MSLWNVPENTRHAWSERLDKFCVICGALVPAGLVVGNIGFESLVSLGGLGWIVRWFISRERPGQGLWAHPLVKPWLLWYLVIVTSMIFNGPGSKGWGHDLIFFRYFLFGFALLDISRRIPVPSYFFYGLAAGVIWAALNTLSAYIFHYDLLGKPLVRYTGKLKEASRISAMAAYAAPLFSLLGIPGSRRRAHQGKLWRNGIGIAAFLLVLQTHVRTSFLAACAGIMFQAAWILGQRRTFKKLVYVFLPVAVAALVSFYFFRKTTIFSLSHLYDRIYYWKVAWAMWTEHPVLGVGISSFQDVYKQVASSGAVSGVVAPGGVVHEVLEETHAHNLIFMLLASTGLAGLGAFAWLFINALRMIIRGAGVTPVELVSWPVVFLVMGLTGFNIYHSWYQALLTFFLVWIGSAHDPKRFTAED